MARIVFSDEARKYLWPWTLAEIDALAPKKRAALVALRAKLPRPLTVSSFEAPHDLGGALVLATEEERRRCEAEAEALWPTAEPRLRGRLLAAFPRRADWAAELAGQVLAAGGNHAVRDVLIGTLADPALAVAIVKKDGAAACIVNLVVAMGEPAALAFGEMLDHVTFANAEKAIARALSAIGTREAADAFARHLRRKNVRSQATVFYATFPELAEAALADLARKKTQIADVARTILAGLARARTADGPAAEDAVDEASAAELPRALRELPWNAAPEKRRRQSRSLPALVVPNEPRRLHWDDSDRQRYVAEHFDELGKLRPLEETTKLEETIAAGVNGYLYANHPEAVMERLLRNPPPHLTVFDTTPAHALALHGARLLDVVLDHHAESLDGDVLLRVESPTLAPILAKKNLDGAHARHVVLWFERYPESGIRGLVPAALGDDEKTARGAGRLLRHLARAGHRALLERIAKEYGEDAHAAIVDVLTARDEEPKKAPKMPPSYRPAELRSPRLRTGKVLPMEAVRVLDERLAASRLELPLEGFEEIREACDPRSLAEHAWDLARAWDIDGGKGRDRWMLHAIAHLGDDEVVRRLTPALKAEGIAPMLGWIGTDAALMELVTILVRTARTGKLAPKYAWGCQEALSLIAGRRGVSVDDLEDHFVPTVNLPEAGAELVLDLGLRSFRVGFDPQLRTILRDDKGERVAALPQKPREGDDPEKLALARTLLADLEEDVAAIAERRAGSLERAMNTGRTWSISDAGPLSRSVRSGNKPSTDFSDVWVTHPLVHHMTRGVLWEARTRSGERRGVFRVAEDGTFADVDDAAIELPEGAVRVGVAHPARLSEADRARFTSTFTDYEILQPFEQLGRTAPPFSAAELAATVVKVPYPASGKGLVRDAQSQSSLARRGFTSSRYSWSLMCEGGVALLLTRAHDGWQGQVLRHGRPIALGEVDEVVRAELAYTLASVRQLP